MNFKKTIILWGPYLFLGIFSFFINYWTGSRGVFSIDTFVHFDSAVRILKHELPIRDFWIVHGLFVDYIQAFLFKIFGINWKAYIIHGSIFNLVITIFSFKVFREFKIEKLHAFLLSISISILAYPVSGTPFLDLHSAFFSLISMYLILLFVKKGVSIKLFFAIIFLGLAFFSKQVPAGYFILLVTLFLFFYSYQIKSFKPLIVSFSALAFFISILLVYLLLTQTNIEDFFLQLFIFPKEIGGSRLGTYSLNFKNVFLNFKLIYCFLIPIIIIFVKKLFDKNQNNKKQINYFLILIFFSISLIFHQIYTKNQIFIFFLVPILCAFLLYFLQDQKIKHKRYFSHFIVILCLLVTFKYHIRFNEERKFHELVNTNINNAIEIKFQKDFFKGLKWITPYFENPEEELTMIEDFFTYIKNENEKNIIITKYTFFSGLLNKSVYTPSRTFDDISYPRLDNKYYNVYNDFFKRNIIKNKIKNIFIFNPGFELTNNDLNNLVFNYLPKNCYELKSLNVYTQKIILQKCEYLRN